MNFNCKSKAAEIFRSTSPARDAPLGLNDVGFLPQARSCRPIKLLRCIKICLFLWRELFVKEYNQRHLAYRSNSAAAFFAAIAMLFEKLTGDQSVVGSLRDDLLYHLVWKPVSPLKKLARGLKDVASWPQLSAKHTFSGPNKLKQSLFVFSSKTSSTFLGSMLGSRDTRYQRRTV